MCSIWEVEQLPVCSKTNFGGGPKVRLRLTKSLSLVRKTNPLVPAYSHIAISDVLLRPTALTCGEPRNKWASGVASPGDRFSSTRSFKDGDPLGDTREEFVDGLEVFLLQ